MTIGVYKQTARDIMTTDVATIRSSETVHDALLLMSENGLAALPVVDRNDSCHGIISQSDIIAMASEADEENGRATGRSFAELLLRSVPLSEVTAVRIDEVMSDSVVTVSPEESVVDIADKMLRNNVHHMPVCDDSGRLLGIVSTMDILNGLREPVSA